MNYFIRFSWGIYLTLCAGSAFSWNATGHRLVAEMALQQVIPEVKARLEQYNQAANAVYPVDNLIEAATWLDTVRSMGVRWFDSFHYVARPYTDDGALLPLNPRGNALWAIEESKKTLQNKRASDFDKGIALRILLHVVADLHQPLHAITRYSRIFPEGDKGGNRVRLGKNPVAKTLHAYWDRGAGFLLIKHIKKGEKLARVATELRNNQPCVAKLSEQRAHVWVDESHSLAIKYAYSLKIGSVPTADYKETTQRITKQQIALASCRLAVLLNQVTI